MGTTAFVVFLSFLTTALANPLIDQDIVICSRRCPESSKFHYTTGTTYTYDYRVETATSMAGASEGTAVLTLETTADIAILGHCEFSLRLRDTRLSHSGGKSHVKKADREVLFRSRLEAYPLRFSYQDGKIDQLCPSNGDDVWAVNVKKGLLSAFQNTMDDVNQSQNVTETDVTGTCSTEYRVVNKGFFTTSLKKTKNILSCTDRHSLQNMIQSTPYSIPSDIQSFPLMKTSHECEQSIEADGILTSSRCSETHIFRPFSNGQSGGSTRVSQELIYQSKKKSSPSITEPFSSRESPLFGHSSTKATSVQARFTVETILGKICDGTRSDIRPETPRLFSELVMAMKSLDVDNMEEIYRLLKTKLLCPRNRRILKFFLDGLPMTNTRGSVRLMSKLIENGDVRGLPAQAWLTSMAFIPQPSSDMIFDVKGLIDDKKTRESAMLPVTSLINNYCRNPISCDQDKSVLAIMSSLEKIIGLQCDASGKKFQEILLTLKALGNAGLTPRDVTVLDRCMTVTSNPTEIRLAAIGAFRRMPCHENKSLWNLFTDRSLDSELRIASYLALMRCPNDVTLTRVASMLTNEDNDQVGGFVYSHLANLKESANPHKQDAAKIVHSLSLERRFKLSPLKSSRNYEISTLIKQLNAGFTADSNVIWSSEDHIPRSFAANLTVELFGQSINIFDFGGRVEGLEYLVRNVLGPYVNANEKREKTEKQFRMNKIHGSLFGRIFGNEMMFIHSETAKRSFETSPSKWLEVLLKLAKKQKLSVSKNAQFIDTRMVIPTCAGLSLHVEVNGTVAVDLQISGQMDLGKKAASLSSMKINGEIKPSAALEVTGTMEVDAFVTKTGLRMRNTMHSSTSLKGRIHLSKGQHFNIEMDTPEDKIEVFGARSKFYILHNDIEEEQELITANRKTYELCSGSTLAKVTGLELCGQVSFPNATTRQDGPFFPLTGPTTLSIDLFKRDTHSGYEFEARKTQNQKLDQAHVSINTPGSQVDRAISVDVTLNYASKMMELNVVSPWKKALMKGTLINDKRLKSIAGRLVIDEVNVYEMTTDVSVVRVQNTIQYSPMFELQRPGQDNVQLFGLVAVQGRGQSLDVDLTLTGIRTLPYTLKVAVVNSNEEKSLRASFGSDGKNIYSLEASSWYSKRKAASGATALGTKVQIKTPTRQLLSISSKGVYRENKYLKMDTAVAIYRLIKRPLSLRVSAVKSDNRKTSRYVFDAYFKSNPVSARLHSKTSIRGIRYVSTKTSFEYNIPGQGDNKIDFYGKFHDKGTKAYKKVVVEGNLDAKKNPEYNLGLNFDLGHKTKYSEVELDVKYGPDFTDKTKTVYFLASLAREITTLKNTSLDFKLKAQAPEHNISLLLEGRHKHTAKLLDSSVRFKNSNNESIKAAIILKDQSKSLMNLVGNVIGEYPERQFVVNMRLLQMSSQEFVHDVTFMSNDGTKHSIYTTYKMPQLDTYQITTLLNIHNRKPITFTGSTTLDIRNPALNAEVSFGKYMYSINTTSTITKLPNAKLHIEIHHPDERMTFDLSASKSKHKIEGCVSTIWDNDKGESKISLDGFLLQKYFRETIKREGYLEFRSPFINFEDIRTSFKSKQDLSESNIGVALLFGEKDNPILANLKLENDISPRNIAINVGFKTPFHRFRQAGISIHHNAESSLNFALKGNLGRENLELVVQGRDESNRNEIDIKGNLTLKTTLLNVKAIVVSFAHALSNGKLISNASLDHNGQRFEYQVNVSGDWSSNLNGSMVVKTPHKGFERNSVYYSYVSGQQSFSTQAEIFAARKTYVFEFSARNGYTTSGAIRFHSPISGMKNIHVELRKSGTMNNIKGYMLFVVNKFETQAHFHHKVSRSTIRSGLNISTPLTESLKLSLDHGRFTRTFTSKISLIYGRRAHVRTTITIGQHANDVTCNAKLKYKNGADRHTTRLDFKKVGSVGDDIMSFDGNVCHNGDEMGVTLVWKNEMKRSSSRQGLMGKVTLDGTVIWQGQRVNVSGSWEMGANVDGHLIIQNPFETFKDMRFFLSHSGYPINFNSSLSLTLRDNKKIGGNIMLATASVETIHAEGHVSTPFENWEDIDFKFNSIYERRTNDVSGNVALSIPIVGIKEARFSKAGSLGNLTMELMGTNNRVETSIFKVSNVIKDNEIHTTVNFKIANHPELSIALDHNGGVSNLKTFVKGTFGKSFVSGEVSLEVKYDVFDGEAKFVSNSVIWGQNRGYFDIHKEGDNNAFTLRTTAALGTSVSKLRGNFKNSDNEFLVTITLNTPMDKFKELGLSFKHKGNLEKFACDGKIQLMDDMTFTGKIDFYRYLFSLIEANIEVTTPFRGFEFSKYEHRHEGDDGNFKCSSSLQYGDSKQVAYDLTVSGSTHPSFTMLFTFPNDVISVSGSMQITGPIYSINGRIRNQHRPLLNIDSTLDVTNDLVCFLDINIPVEDFTDIGGAFTYYPQNHGFKSTVKITYMNERTISSTIDFSLSDNGANHLLAELRTPFTGYELTSYEESLVIDKNLLKSTMKFIYSNNRVIVYEVYTATKPKQQLVVSLKTPFDNYEAFTASILLDPKVLKYDFSSTIKMDRPYSLQISLDFFSDLHGALNISTPFKGFNDVGMYFLHSGHSENIVTDARITYMDGKEIYAKVNFYRYMWRRIILSTALHIPFIGIENAKTEASFEENSSSISAMAAFEYDNGNQLSGSVKLAHSPNYDIMLNLKTPFAGYNFLRSQAFLDVTGPSYEIAYSVDSGYTNAYSARGQIDLVSIKNFGVSLEMNTPVPGHEHAKVEYSHKMDSDEIGCSIFVARADGQETGGELALFMSQKLGGVFRVKTPIAGFNDMHVSASFEQSQTTHDMEFSVNLGNGQLYSVTAGIHYSKFPSSLFFKVITPYTSLKKIRLIFTHDGEELNDFATVILLEFPFTGVIRAGVSLKYGSVLSMAARASLQTVLPGLGHLRTEVKTSHSADGSVLNLLMGWTSEQEISIHSTYRHRNSWYEDKVISTVTVSTPFMAIRCLMWKMETTDMTSSVRRTMNFDLNGNTVLDADSDYTFNDKPELKITFKKPWPMLYTASMSYDIQVFYAEIFINWNRDDPHKNLRFRTDIIDSSTHSQTETSFLVKVIHPSRQAGVVSKITMDSKVMVTNGQVFWDVGDKNKVSYDLQIRDNSKQHIRKLDGSFSLRLPSRTLRLANSYSGDEEEKAAEMKFHWDTDRDESKAIGLKGAMTRADGVKLDIVLSLPSWKKEIRVDGHAKVKKGRLVFDTKTDFSYSRDPKKSLTLTSNLADMSDHSTNNINYSLSLGVSHPHTNLDLHMNSHLGTSDERLEFGMSTNYLSGKRHFKTLALLAEINKLKKNIKLRVKGPRRRTEVSGGVASVNPYKLRLTNTVNGMETFHSDVTVHQNSKSFVLTTITDSADKVSSPSKYPNSGSVERSVAPHKSQGAGQTGAMIGVYLNKSRLLHVKVSWRPEDVANMRRVLLNLRDKKEGNAFLVMAEIKKTFGDEVASKFLDIAEEASAEFRPFIKTLHEAFSAFGSARSVIFHGQGSEVDYDPINIQGTWQGIKTVLKMLQDKLLKLANECRTYYQQFVQSVSHLFLDLNLIPFLTGAKEAWMFLDNVVWIDERITQSWMWIKCTMDELDKRLLVSVDNNTSNFHQNILDGQSTSLIYNTSYEDCLRENRKQSQNENSFPSQSSTINSPKDKALHDVFCPGLYELLNVPLAGYKHLRVKAVEFYHQLVWPFESWEPEKYMSHSTSIVRTVGEKCLDEIKQISEELHSVIDKVVTVWDTEHGEIATDLPLPVEVKRLDEIPKFFTLLNHIGDMVVCYWSDRITWNKFVQVAINAWSADELNNNNMI